MINVFNKLQRITSWKNHLFPPFLSIIYLSFSEWEINTQTLLSIGLFLLATFFTGALGYWLNDCFDVDVDRKAGKKNSTAKLSTSHKKLIFFTLFLSAIVSWIFSAPPVISYFFFSAEIIALIIYPMPPFRLKEHPLLGPLCDAHYSHILPVFITLSYFFPLFILENYIIVLLIYVLLLFKGLRNILLHQIEDRKGDRIAEIDTFPIHFGSLFTINLINRVLLPSEICFLLIIIFCFFSTLPMLLFGFGFFLLFYFLNFSGWKFCILPYRQLKFKFLFFLNDFYEYWIPYLCIWSTSLNMTDKLILTLINGLLFYRGIKKTITDSKKIAVNLADLVKY